MRIRYAAVAAMAAVIGVGASACSSAPGGDPTGAAAVPAFDDRTVPAADHVAVGHALEAYPSASPSDWVSYADHVSLFTVLDERAQPWGEHEKRYGEGMVGRDVTVRVDQVLWQSRTAPEIPGEYSAGTVGWALTDGDLSPMGVLGGPRLEVGRRYLGAWIYSSRAGWSVLSTAAVFPVDDHGRPQRHEWSEPSLAGRTFVGTLPWQVSWTLSEAAPDPRVSRYAHLEPWARRVAVDLAQLPDRPGFLRATREQVAGSQLGYVREADWQRLQRERDTAGEVPFYDEAGNRASAGEGGGITVDGFVLEE